jgi:hypothetical protein
MMESPNLTFTPLRIGDVEYKLCFDNNAIADAEEKLIAAGHKVNLLAAKLGSVTMSSARTLFCAALSVYHPDVTEAEARALYGKADTLELANAIQTGYRDYLPEPVADPQTPAAPTEPQPAAS